MVLLRNVVACEKAPGELPLELNVGNAVVLWRFRGVLLLKHMSFVLCDALVL